MSKAGEKIIRGLTEAVDIARIAAKLTDNQREVIRGLFDEDSDGIAPMDFGGMDASHHSGTATALCKREHPLVERRKRGVDWGERPKYRGGSYVYRLTDLGNSVAQAIGCKRFAFPKVPTKAGD